MKFSARIQSAVMFAGFVAVGSLQQEVALTRRLLLVAATSGDWRQYTAIVPLGPASNTNGDDKVRGMTLETLAARLIRDSTDGATGRGGYLITGDIDSRLFDDNCRFVDPTNDVASLSRYRKALSLLFDADVGQSVTLLGQPIIDTDRRAISASLRVSPGILKLPWRPRIRAFDTNITWYVGNDGVIREQTQQWSISAVDALLQTFTPGFTVP